MRSLSLRIKNAFAPGGTPGAVPTPGYRKLVYASIVLTLLLVIIGGVVRISDSGLGCGPAGSGTEGWPLCGGRVVPLIDTNMIIEYAHRVLAGVVAVLIAVIAFLARRRYASNRQLSRTTLAALGLVLFQAALGGLTVEKGLEDELVAAHLGVAMLQIALLIAIARLAGAPEPGGSESAAAGDGDDPRLVGQGIRVLAVGATVAVLATIVAGGYMSANELHGTDRAGPSVHTACGEEFPSCGGEFLPFGRSRALDIHLTHRAFMYIASALVLALLIAVVVRGRRRPSPASRRLTAAAAVAAGVLAVQVLLGALNVWLGEIAWLVVVHLTVGTLLWCSLVYVSLLALKVPRRVPAPAARERQMEALPA
jgi:heme A synthase